MAVADPMFRIASSSPLPSLAKDSDAGGRKQGTCWFSKEAVSRC